jgi:hypothetical protein
MDLALHMLDVLGVENVRWEMGNAEPAAEYDFSVDGKAEIISYLRDVCYITESFELCNMLFKCHILSRGHWGDIFGGAFPS